MSKNQQTEKNSSAIPFGAGVAIGSLFSGIIKAIGIVILGTSVAVIADKLVNSHEDNKE